MLNKNPGASFTLTAVFADPAGKTVPLGALPTATESTGAITLSPVGTPAVGDAQFQFTGSVPADAVAGTQYTITLSAEGDPTPGVDTITGTFTVGVAADEDTTVTITGE